MKKKERKALYRLWYQGRDEVEVLHYSVVYGRTYAEIRFMDGHRHTVPAEELYNTQSEVEHDA